MQNCHWSLIDRSLDCGREAFSQSRLQRVLHTMVIVRDGNEYSRKKIKKDFWKIQWLRLVLASMPGGMGSISIRNPRVDRSGGVTRSFVGSPVVTPNSFLCVPFWSYCLAVISESSNEKCAGEHYYFQTAALIYKWFNINYSLYSSALTGYNIFHIN